MNYRSLCILGRQPAIGRAELESLCGADNLQPAGEFAVASSLQPDEIAFERLGSTVKLGEFLGTIHGTEWHQVQRALVELAVRRAQDLSEGKIQLGLSVYGLRVQPKQLMAAGLELKKALRRSGYSVRLIPNQEPALSSAQVLHNHLAGERGLELLIVRDGAKILVARTTATQDITAYAHRDRGRPKRDAFVGMLPPKLAQTIVNLATGPLPPSPETTVLDPFCGTGVLLQEALLMGYSAYGTDLEPRMIDYSRKNLEWLSEQLGNSSDERSVPTNVGGSTEAQPDKNFGDHRLQNFSTARERSPTLVGTEKPKANWTNPTLEPGDATAHKWSHPFKSVATETYLGRPLSTWPTPEKLQEIIGTCNIIIEKFLSNIGTQSPPGTRFCLALPAWISPSGKIHHLPLLDRLHNLGYNRVSFSGVDNRDLVYHRPGQIVGRELLVIIRK